MDSIRIVAAIFLLVCFGVSGAGAATSAEVPQLLNYQGKLTDSSGKPVDSPRYMTFECYDAPFGGNLLEGFSETQQVVVTKGMFNVLIGSATAGGVPASVFDHASVYLSVKVEGEQLTSRQRVASVAYAFRSAQATNATNAMNAANATHAGDASTLEGHAASDFALKGDPPDVAAMQAELADLREQLSTLAATHWTLTIESPQGNGSTSLPSASYGYHVGSSSAPVSGTGNAGWLFDHWEGTAVSGAPRSNPISIPSGTAAQTTTLKAVFVEERWLAPMCSVPAGEFTTGTGTIVYLDAFLVDKYEVTNQLYAMFLSAGGNDDHYHSGMSAEISCNGTAAPFTYQVAGGFDKRPVRWVSYFDATDFCAWRSVAEGLPAGSYRLPTEAEWEKAAGWDPLLHFLWTYAYPSDSYSGMANICAIVGTTRDVGSYTAWKSYYGCYDMTGNAMEWCYDWYANKSYPSSTSNPTGPMTGTLRVLRGGCYNSSHESSEVDYRNYDNPSIVSLYVGFRCARTAQ